MEMLPPRPPHPGYHGRKGRARFAIPRRAASAWHALREQLRGGQRDERVETPQPWGGAGHSAIRPLALRVHAQRRSGLCKRHCHRPAPDNPGPHRLGRMLQRGRPQRLRLAGLLGGPPQAPAEGDRRLPRVRPPGGVRGDCYRPWAGAIPLRNDQRGPVRTRIRPYRRPRRPARAFEPGATCGPRCTRRRGIREGGVKPQPCDVARAARS